MKKRTCLALTLVAAVFAATAALSFAVPPAELGPAGSAGRERLLIDAGWHFAFGHPADPARDFDHATGYFSYFTKAGYGDGPAAATFDDRAWRLLDLPHDWAVEAPFDPKGSTSHGFKAIGRNFPERSIGWYRKTFAVPAADLGRRISVEFDGVFRDSVVWVNGFYLGRQPSGYTSFRYDLTDYLNYGGDNVISVRVDATMEEGWFYEGAGIYRHVWLAKTAPLHVARWGTYVTTEVGEGAARVSARTTVANEGLEAATFDVEQSVLDPDGRVVATGTLRALSVAAGAEGEFPCVLDVSKPQLWSLESPALHRLETTIRAGGAIVDRYETTFGIRTIRFDPDHGFFLNGRHVEIHGTNNHQDHAGVGIALPDALQAFRVARLKELGVNAYRTSHHPPTPEFLDACDRLGLLVLDENRLMGPSPEQMGQLESMIRRDRNHPSVIIWSLGNEEWAIEGNIKGARITASMQAFAHRLDPTRRTTVANSGGWGGTSTVIDLVGYNYINQSNPDDQHAKFPRQPGVGTEEATNPGTRGIYFDDPPRAHLGFKALGDTGGNCEKGWKYYADRPFLAGLFFWTGFDYRGEPMPYEWPEIYAQFGFLDGCGFPKDTAYYLKSWWTDQPVLHLYPHWNWPGKEGQPIDVVCFSNHEAVELFLNGGSLGKKEMPRNGHLEWKVAYAPGALEARGYRGGQVVATTRVETTGAPTQLVLTPDRSAIKSDGADVAVFTVSAHDAQGRTVPTAANPVSFEVAGGRIIGVGNGDPGCHEPDRFIETVDRLPVEDWRGRIAPAGTVASAPPDSLPPFPKLGNWQAPLPKPGEVYDLCGTLTLQTVPAGALELILPTFGAKTTLWLNGHELVRDLDTSKVGPALRLEPAQLVAGVNRVQLMVAPFDDKKNHIPELTRLGSLQVIRPAPTAQRSLFNGLAQVIVQSTREPGEIRLTAKSDGLAPAAGIVGASRATPLQSR
jgi:beta-galactosidase